MTKRVQLLLGGFALLFPLFFFKELVLPHFPQNKGGVMSSVRLLLFQLIFLLFLNLGFGTTTNLIRKPLPNLPIPTPPPLLPTNETCFEYELENECSSLLSDVDVNSTIQEILFDSISWNVSDVRMIPSDCRRPLLWFVCGLVFPRCPSETVEQQICRQVEGCRQVNERCESFGLSFDCLFPSLEIRMMRKWEMNVQQEFSKKLKKQQKMESKWKRVWEKKKKQLNAAQIHLLWILKGNVLLSVYNMSMESDLKEPFESHYPSCFGLVLYFFLLHKFLFLQSRLLKG